MGEVATQVLHKKTLTLHEWELELMRTRPERVCDRADSKLASPHSRNGYGGIKEEPKPSYPRDARSVDLLKHLSKPEKMERVRDIAGSSSEHATILIRSSVS
jgi:hypothetical protein